MIVVAVIFIGRLLEPILPAETVPVISLLGGGKR